jgi:hypothetical protein
MYDQSVSHMITQAVDRLQSDMEQRVPVAGKYAFQWIQTLSGSDKPEDYFKHPAAFPILLLPWWAETSLGRMPDAPFQADLVYSTMNGYYYIRLIDNLMDDHATTELRFLPILGFFHTNFQRTYHRHFPYDHPFWDFFTQIWFQSGETAIQDAELMEINECQFKQTAAQKSCAAKIPLAAVCYRYDRPDLLQPWSEFVDLFSCWHQMFNDLFDWHRDDQRQNLTFFLSEAARRRDKDEPVAAWVAREGFTWAIDKMEAWMSALHPLAHNLNSPELTTYLNLRQATLLEQKEAVMPGLQVLAKIVAASRPGSSSPR